MTTATPAKTKAYEELTSLLRDAAVLHSMQATLAWDQETMMPPGGAPLRAEQLETLAGMVHTKKTDPRIGELIAACEDDSEVMGDARRSANVREIRRDYELATKLPGSLVGELARASSLGMEAWKDARSKSDFAIFLPWLQKTVDLNRRKAECYGVPSWGAELYDALMDEYEPKMTAARTQEIFRPLREFTVKLVERVKASKAPAGVDEVHTAIPIEKQKEFSRRVLEAFGFDFRCGRLDESAHPFCEGAGPGDVRLTNRYSEKAWLDQLSSASHEGGHGLYEQGLPKAEYFGQPLGDAISLGIHESQSRMWENQIARSRGFWEWAIGVAKDVMGAPVAGMSADQVFRAANVVEPSFIRVEADEVTYNLHIMLRFDLERAMIAGDLKPKDLPGIWNERMKKDLGLTVPDDRRGCLQDVHWSMGAIGYFATYTFGNLYSAQFWEAMARAIPDRDDQIRRGEFGAILAWLREHIHGVGRQYSAGELCERVTGKPLASEPLMRHLEAKVESVYG
ncbi:MAG: carboxypeptidase M32 [Phycisphaeraceae bacterium]|nr:MAG: carboxypeptidase M32 [Phycisphaeraceae bacterium]